MNMKPDFLKNLFTGAFCLLLLAAALFLPSHAACQEDGQALALRTTPDQSKTMESILSRLEETHYRKLAIDDELSSDLLDRYLDYLDPSRSLFRAGDVKEFEPFRYTLDDALRKGDLEPAFKIFNRLEQRLIERLEYLNRALENDFEALRFDVDETLQLDRKEMPWIASPEEADDLWRKLFKNDVLNLKLTGKSMEEIKEILGTRYASRLRRARQTNSGDAFQIYMIVFTQSYDPHTEYFPPRRAENFDIQMKLSYEGIGALLNSDGEYTKVARIIPGGPAEKSNVLKPGDRIVGVAQGDEEMVDTIGWRLDEVVELIRGPKDSVVRLNVIPANQPDTGSTRIIQFTRDKVKLEEQAAQRRIVEVKRDDRTFKVGLIELPAFYMDFKAMQNGDRDYKSSTRDVANLIEELKAEKVDGIVVDLRGNGGGSLMEARDLTALFAGPGPIVQIRDSRDRVRPLHSQASPAFNGPVAVLVDRLSASASEIFAGAVQDYGRGLVVGGRTFGKGTVQSLVPLEDGQLKVTQAKFYRISGGSTQHRGIIPDISFPPMYDYEQIGESALDGAMPWDKINPVKHARDDTIRNMLPTLRRLHEERMAKDPESVYLTENLAYMGEAKKRTEVSLKEDVRKKEREENETRLLAMKNKERVAEGKDPVKSFDELDSAGDDPPAGTEADLLAREAVNALVDYLTHR